MSLELGGHLPTIDVTELDRLRHGPDAPLMVDVRETWERDIGTIEGSQHIPLGELSARAAELPKDREMVIFCHHGARSAKATTWLRQQGYRASNLHGGIDAWSEEIDPKVDRY